MPYIHGFSHHSIGENIKSFEAEGYPREQAIAMSLEVARRAFRKAHPRGSYPAHLKGVRKPSGSHSRRRRPRHQRQHDSGRGYVVTFAYYDPHIGWSRQAVIVPTHDPVEAKRRARDWAKENGYSRFRAIQKVRARLL